MKIEGMQALSVPDGLNNPPPLGILGLTETKCANYVPLPWKLDNPYDQNFRFIRHTHMASSRIQRRRDGDSVHQSNG